MQRPMTRRERTEQGVVRRGFGPQTAVMKRTTMLEEAQARADETGRVLVVHSGASWDALGGGQRPQQLAEEFAGEALTIHLNISNPNRIQRPVTDVVVASTGRAVEWLEKLDAPVKVLYSSFPDAHLWQWLGEIDDDWLLWYDCVDDWASFGEEESAPDWFSARRERNVIRRADLVTATAQRLVEHCGEGHFLPNSTRLLEQPEPQDVEAEYDLIFVGTMVERWIDWGLIERLIMEGFSVRLVGTPPTHKPVEADSLDWYGQVANHELREVLATGRVGIVPFADLPLVHAVWPIKYADYLTVGLRTVAAFTPELDDAPWCAVAYDEDSFVQECWRALETDCPRTEIMAEAEEHTAAARCDAVRPLLQEVAGW